MVCNFLQSEPARVRLGLCIGVSAISGLRVSQVILFIDVRLIPAAMVPCLAMSQTFGCSGGQLYGTSLPFCGFGLGRRTGLGVWAM